MVQKSPHPSHALVQVACRGCVDSPQIQETHCDPPKSYREKFSNLFHGLSQENQFALANVLQLQHQAIT